MKVWIKPSYRQFLLSDLARYTSDYDDKDSKLVSGIVSGLGSPDWADRVTLSDSEFKWLKGFVNDTEYFLGPVERD